jgi:hypothetical protein
VARKLHPFFFGIFNFLKKFRGECDLTISCTLPDSQSGRTTPATPGRLPVQIKTKITQLEIFLMEWRPKEKRDTTASRPVPAPSGPNRKVRWVAACLALATIAGLSIYSGLDPIYSAMHHGAGTHAGGSSSPVSFFFFS